MKAFVLPMPPDYDVSIKHRLRDFAIFDEATPLFSPWWENMT